MSFGYVLLWLVGLSTVSLLWRLLRPRVKPQLGWILTAISILLVLAFVALTNLEAAGFVGTGLWILLILLPQLTARRAEKAVLLLQWDRAHRLALVARLFHPTDGYWQLPGLIKILSGQGKSGSTPQVALFQMLDRPFPVYYNLIAYALQLAGEWRFFSEWIEKQPPRTSAVDNDPVLFALYARALGESMQFSKLVSMYSQSAPRLRVISGSSRAILQLFLFAFTGRRAALDRALFFAIRQYPEGIKEYWRATCEAAAGHPDLAAERFRFLALSADPRVRLGAERRLATPIPPALSWISQEELAFVQSLEVEADKDSTITQRISFLRQRPLITQGLIALNVIYFVYSISQGGSENEVTLYLLGALVPRAVWQDGEYWRLIAAAFLHYGPLHLLMNMFALNILGPFVENALGRFRYAVAYFLCAILSMGTVTALSIYLQRPTELLVGASGAVMGLIGITASLFLRVRYTQRAAIASERLRAIGMAMLLQVAFDLSTREVSFTAHASGFVAGLIVGMLVKHHLTPNSKGL